VSRTFPFGFVQLFSTGKLTHGVHKALFGSHWFLLTEIYRQQQWVNAIREPSTTNFEFG